MALAFSEFAELSDCVGICDVLAIPRQKIFRFPKHRKRDVQRVAHFGVRDKPTTEILVCKGNDCRFDGQNRQVRNSCQPKRRQFGIASCDFVQHHLGNDAFVGWLAVVPPLPCQILTRRNDAVPTGSRNELTDDSAFNINRLHGNVRCSYSLLWGAARQ